MVIVTEIFTHIFGRLKILINDESFLGSFRFFITLLSLLFIGNLIFINSEMLGNIDLTRRVFYWLILSTFISISSLLMNALAWSFICDWLGVYRKGINLITLFLTTNILKYLPGGIWHFVERIRVINRNSGQDKAITSVILEPFLMLSAALLFIPLGGFQSGFGLLCVFPIVFFSRNLRRPMLKGLKILIAKKLEVIASESKVKLWKNELSLRGKDYPYKALLMELVFLILRFGGFWCCLRAFYIDLSIPFFQWLAIFCFAWLIGLVVPAAPGGVGIFETCLFIRIGTLVPEPPLLASLLCYRLVVSFSDLIVAFVVWLNRIYASYMYPYS